MSSELPGLANKGSAARFQITRWTFNLLLPANCELFKSRFAKARKMNGSGNQPPNEAREPKRAAVRRSG